MGRPYTTEAQFWSKATPEPNTGCWLWTASLGGNGVVYGQVKWRDRQRRAHSVAHELATGTRPPVVMHLCDQPSCINPAHLRGGTQADNMADKVRKGRQARGAAHGTATKPHRIARGERHGQAKLNDVSVQVIRCVHAAKGATQVQLAKWFHVSQSQISRILTGQNRS